MEDFFWSIDLSVFKFFNQTLSFDWLNQITPILTDLDHHAWFKYPALALVVFFFLKKYKRAGVTYFLLLSLSIATSDFVGGKVKKVFLRPRPFQVVETGAIQRAPAKENRSFYSNHSSNMFAAATYMTAFFPGGQIAFYAVAATIGATRVHVGVHYPSDVLFGGLMGCLWGFLFSRLAHTLNSKLSAKEQKS